MRYTPYTESEIQSMNVMEEGIYVFQVIEVHTQDKYNQPMRDKNGNDLAKLKLMVWDKNNKERILYTFISGDGNFAYKLRHFAKSIGKITQYEEGIFHIHETVGLSGKADVVVKKGTIKADGSGEMWPDRNDVKDFIACEELKSSKSLENPNLQVPQSEELDDDVPF
jgi:hypothetical protein